MLPEEIGTLNELINAVKLEGIETYLTDNFIISNSKTIKITKYKYQCIYKGRIIGVSEVSKITGIKKDTIYHLVFGK